MTWLPTLRRAIVGVIRAFADGTYADGTYNGGASDGTERRETVPTPRRG